MMTLFIPKKIDELELQAIEEGQNIYIVQVEIEKQQALEEEVLKRFKNGVDIQ